ncbi:MAG: T9SS type A sorting domain-containing protein [Candidatus Cloacimonadota bacterium]|nr:MAG: T9SS type A sorting domain-containing protein [Candidatus Cloacimonadota bacterium]
MKTLIIFSTLVICMTALNVSGVVPMDPWSSPQVTNSYSNNPITEDLSDMKVARAIGVENNPFYYSLETLTFEERKNARIDIEFMLPVSKSIEMFANEIENKWNSEYFDEALTLLAELDEMEGVKGNALIGISWRTPIPAPASDWGNDVQISARDSVFVLAMDHHNGNDNLFAVLGFTGDGTGSHFTVNISTDGGYNWSETFMLGGFSFVMNDVDGMVCANHFYVGYTGGLVSAPNAMAWLKCFQAANGASDTFPDGSSSYKVFETTLPDTVMDVEVSSNHDQYNNRLYFSAITKNGSVRFFWGFPDQVNWSENTTGITDALQGLDLNWNLNYSDYFMILSYIDNSDNVQIYGLFSFDNLITYGINSTPSYFTTSCGAYGDTLFCAFSYDGTYMEVRYLVRYGTGGTWYQGSVGTSSENNYTPDVTLRGAGGTHAAYRGLSTTYGYYRYRGYSGTWSTPFQFNDNAMSGDIRPEIEFVGSGAYGILYRTPIFNLGICYFDRSDAAVAESPAKTPASSFVKLYPNITKGKAHLSYAITKPGNVRLELFDVTGRLVKTLFNGYRRAGDYRTEVNASSITPGVYFMKINTPDGGFTERLTILK